MAMGKMRRTFIYALASLLCACAIVGFEVTPAVACSHDQVACGQPCDCAPTAEECVSDDIPAEGFYRVTLPASVQNGSISASKAEAEEHEIVYLTPEPAEGFHVASVRAYYEENGTVVELPVPKQQFLGYSIDMPAADVSVEVEFAEGVIPPSDPSDKSGSFKKADVEQVIANNPGARESFEEFYRTDFGSEKPYASGNIKNRIFAEGWYTLGSISGKNGADPTFQPSTEGMDTNTIFASGSRSFFEDEFRGLVAELRVAAQGKKIVIVDLRDESHAFINGIGVSWFGYLNWGNYGKTMDEIIADEHERFGTLLGKHVRTYAMSGDTKSTKSYLDIDVDSVKYEDELAAEEGCDYLRIPGPDHSWPAPEKVDELINYLKTQDRDNIWLHFHCSGGVGRTGAFLVMYDKLQNPQVPMKDIVYRQAMTGSNFFYQPPEEGSYKAPFVVEKIRQCGLFAEYVEQNAADDYPISYTDWLKQRGEY